MRNSFYSSIAKQLQEEQDELHEAEDVTKIVFPVLDGLGRKQIVNPVVLKAKLAKLDPQYRDAVYGLCRIAIDGGPEGSFIVLDPEKVLYLLDEIEVEEELDNKKKRNRKFISGITKKIVGAIKSMVIARLSALCHLVNDAVSKKVINVPSPDGLRMLSKAIPLKGRDANNSR